MFLGVMFGVGLDVGFFAVHTHVEGSCCMNLQILTQTTRELQFQIHIVVQKIMAL